MPDCGCRIEIVDVYPPVQAIHYCPMHAAAERIMTLLKRFERIVADAPDDSPVKQWRDPIKDVLREAGDA